MLLRALAVRLPHFNPFQWLSQEKNGGFIWVIREESEKWCGENTSTHVLQHVSLKIVHGLIYACWLATFLFLHIGSVDHNNKFKSFLAKSVEYWSPCEMPLYLNNCTVKNHLFPLLYTPRFFFCLVHATHQSRFFRIIYGATLLAVLWITYANMYS